MSQIVVFDFSDIPEGEAGQGYLWGRVRFVGKGGKKYTLPEVIDLEKICGDEPTKAKNK